MLRLLLVLATSSSESALPSLLERLQDFSLGMFGFSMSDLGVSHVTMVIGCDLRWFCVMAIYSKEKLGLYSLVWCWYWYVSIGGLLCKHSRRHLYDLDTINWGFVFMWPFTCWNYGADMNSSGGRGSKRAERCLWLSYICFDVWTWVYIYMCVCHESFGFWTHKVRRSMRQPNSLRGACIDIIHV